MKNGTTLVPGWYISFQAAVLQQLPRPDQLDQATAEGWCSNQGILKNELVDTLLSKKFALLADLGIVTVPGDYFHETYIDILCQKNSDTIISPDKNCPDPSFILNPGDRFQVKIFKQIMPGLTRSEERIAFLEKQEGNIFIGTQGTLLAVQQKYRDLPMPSDCWCYVFFDEKYNPFKKSTDHPRLSSASVFRDDRLRILLGYPGAPWDSKVLFFGFRLIK